jgi:hypothetical protein
MEVTFEWRTDANSFISNLTSFFSVSAPSKCAVTEYSLIPDLDLNVVSSDFIYWSQFINVDKNNGVITVAHNANPLNETRTYLVYFIVKNMGLQANYKPVSITINFPKDNQPPFFKDPLPNGWSLIVYEDD